MTDASLFVIAAPSGAGKTTLVQALTRNNPDLKFSISYTTRPQRKNEAAGVDYFFVTEDRFAELVEHNDLLEHATVFDNSYGTSRSQVQKHLDDGHNVILEIDWQGARQVRKSMPEAVSIFILPPSVEELERRLRSRGTDAPDVIERRLRDAMSDMSHWSEFDYVVFNDDLDRARADLEDVLAGRGERSSTATPKLRAAVEEMLGVS